MMNRNNSLIDAVLQKTNGGLDVLLELYPQAAEVISKRGAKFKRRPDEKDPSCTIREVNGIWKVHDFGVDAHEWNCFDAYMQEHNIRYFSEALHAIANRYGVGLLRPEVNHSNVRWEDITDTDSAKAGDFEYVEKEEPSEADLNVMGPFVTKEILKKYNYKVLASYSTIYFDKKKNCLVRRTTTSSDNYPIFMHDCGDFKKMYCPLACKTDDQKFLYFGKKQKDYINGLDVAQQAYDKLQANKDVPGNSDEDKLRYIFICSGERDAMNLAGMGYYPVWLNSETSDLPKDVYYKLKQIATDVINVPDLDGTGVKQGNKLALEYIDLYTIHLPQWIMKYTDYRQKRCKDLCDFLRLHPSKEEFQKMVDNAMQAKFWSHRWVESKDGSLQERVEIKSMNLLYYLRINGFCKIEDKITKEAIPCRITDYIVEPQQPRQIRDFVRGDLMQRLQRNSVLEAYINSKKTTQSLYDDLETIQVTYDVSTPTSRTLFFDNCVLNITKDKVTRIDARSYKGMCLKDKVIPRRYEELPPAFHIDEQGCFSIDSTRSKLFCYLINGSRMSWREEFENRATGNPETDTEYAATYKFAIDGPRLTYEEQNEQLQHLLNKIYAYGYLLHHFKRESMAKCVWIMEGKLTNEDESSGGSGKSIFIRALKKLNMADIAQIDGRDLDITRNSHFLDRVTTHTDILQIEDAAKNFPFDTFYSKITGQLIVNPKGTKSFEIDYKDSPYTVISSNFPWKGDDRSTLRRLLPIVFSDYYHEQGDNDLYRETRKVCDDFDGQDLFDLNYTADDFNADYNFLINCIQFYLSYQKTPFMPPMERVMARLRRNMMGDNFAAWADVYFAEDENNPSPNLDRLLVKQDIYEDYKREDGQDIRNISINSFKKKLKIWCQDKGYEFCPKDIPGYNDENKRITKRLSRGGQSKSTEMIYIRTSLDKPYNPQLPYGYI